MKRLRIAAATVLVPVAAAARGGGGSHSGGGHSSGGYSFGGHYGGGWSSYSASGGYYSNTNGSSIFWLLIIFVVVVFIAYKKGMVRAFDSNDSPANSGEPWFMPESGATVALYALAERDPGFDRERFLSRSEMAFLLLRQAEIRDDADAGRAFVSPEFFERWAVDIANRKASGQKLVLGGLNIRAAEFGVVTQQNGRDQLRVIMQVVSSVFVIDAASERVVAGSTEEYTQSVTVTFERSIHAVTKAGGGAVERKCAACGAPLRLRDTGECTHCDAVLTGGAFDWIITDIQCGSLPVNALGFSAMVQMRNIPLAAEGLAQIQARDPAFTVDDFTDRVRKTFAAVQAAWAGRDLERGRIFMSEGLYLAWAMQIEAMLSMHRINHLENMHVQNVDVVSVARTAQFETITVAIRASAVDYETDDRTGKVVFGDRYERPFVELWVFQRTAEAVSVKHGLSEGTCPACGAPLQLSEVGECGYCSAAVRSGKFDWVLTRIIQTSD